MCVCEAVCGCVCLSGSLWVIVGGCVGECGSVRSDIFDQCVSLEADSGPSLK